MKHENIKPRIWCLSLKHTLEPCDISFTCCCNSKILELAVFKLPGNMPLMKLMKSVKASNRKRPSGETLEGLPSINDDASFFSPKVFAPKTKT